jgi:hypothetical protein
VSCRTGWTRRQWWRRRVRSKWKPSKRSRKYRRLNRSLK